MDPYGTPYGSVAYNSHPALLVKSPTEYLYMKLIRFFLRIVSGWPVRELKEQTVLIVEGAFLAVYNTCLAIIFLLLQIWYLYENMHRLSFLQLGHIIIVIMFNILSTSRGFCLCLSQDYRNFCVKFLTKMHLFYYKNKSDYSRKVYLKVHKISNYFTTYLMMNMASAVIFFNAVPFLKNARKGVFNGFQDPVNTTFELAIYFKLPFDPEQHVRSYVFSFFLNWYATGLCGCSIIMFDLLLSIMIFNLWGHFKILLHDLQTFPRPAVRDDCSVPLLVRDSVMFSDIEQQEITVRLRECIMYHRLIISFTTEMSERFGVVLLVYYTYHQISGCLMLLECSQGNSEALALYLPLLLMMLTELIQISVIFEIIGTMSEKVRDEVYCLPWEYMDRRNRSIVAVFMSSVREPVHVKAGGLVNVGVATMASILKTSFSYFTFLRTMSH